MVEKYRYMLGKTNAIANSSMSRWKTHGKLFMNTEVKSNYVVELRDINNCWVAGSDISDKESIHDLLPYLVLINICSDSPTKIYKDGKDLIIEQHIKITGV